MPTNDSTSDSSRTIEAVLRASDILEGIQELDGAGVTELASHMDYSKATVHNHLVTLQEAGFIQKDGEEYTLGNRFIRTAGYIKKTQIEMYQPARRELMQLVRETGEFGQIMIEDEGLGLYIEKFGGESAIGTDYYVGERYPLHSTAAGKSILAFTSDEKKRRILDQRGLDRITENTVTDEGELLEELRTIRDRGYALNDEESAVGIRAVGVPITDENKSILGSISLSGPVSRIQGDRFTEKLPERLLESSNIIEVNTIYHKSD